MNEIQAKQYSEECTARHNHYDELRKEGKELPTYPIGQYELDKEARVYAVKQGHKILNGMTPGQREKHNREMNQSWRKNKDK